MSLGVFLSLKFFLEQFHKGKGDSVVKNLPAMQDPTLIPELGRSSGERNGNPLQYACLGNRMDKGAWQATFGVTKELDMTQRLNSNSIGVGVNSSQNACQNLPVKPSGPGLLFAGSF